MESESLDDGVRPARQGGRLLVIFGMFCAVIAAGIAAAWYEARDSRLQAHFFTEFAHTISFEMQAGRLPSMLLVSLTCVGVD